MKKIALCMVLFFLSLAACAVFGAEAQTLPVMRQGERPDGLDIRTGLLMRLDNIKPVIASFTTVSASDTIVVPVTYSYCRIADNATPSTNILSLAAASEGMLLYIFNNDASATSGIATISSGKCGQLFYASGSWRLIADE